MIDAAMGKLHVCVAGTSWVGCKRGLLLALGRKRRLRREAGPVRDGRQSGQERATQGSSDPASMTAGKGALPTPGRRVEGALLHPDPQRINPWVNLYSNLPPHRRHAPCTQRRLPSDMPASRRSSQLPPAPSRRAARPSHESPAPQSPLALHKRALSDWPDAPHWPAR